MTTRTGWGRIVSSLKGLVLGPDSAASPQAAQSDQPLPSSESVRAAFGVASSLFDENRWRAALEALDAADAGRSTDPAALALWIKCKGSLGERAPLAEAFERLLSLEGVALDHLTDAYVNLGEEGLLEHGRALEAHVNGLGLSSQARARALSALPRTLWSADRTFEALASTTATHEYDALLALVKERFPRDERLDQVKPRPIDQFEETRLATAEEQKRRRALRASRAALEDERQKHQAIGTAPTDDGSIQARLEAAIFAHRDDEEAHRVYGDWLQQQGDVRGELVTLQAERLRRADDPELRVAEEAVLARVTPALLGALATYRATRPTFRLGFLHALRLAAESADEHDGTDLLAAFLSMDECRYVRELTIGWLGHDSGELDFTETITQLAGAADRLPSLESLFIGDFTSEQCELSWSELGDASPLYPAFPRLRALKLRAGRFELGRIVLPELERFAIETGGLDRVSLAAVTDASWPRLRSLSLWFGQDDYGCDCQVDDVARLLQRADLKLTHLGLANAEFTDELCPLLVRSPLVAGLETLDLSLGCLTGVGARVLAENRGRLRHLRRLDLSRNCLDDEAIAVVSGLCPEVLIGEQDDRAEDGHRFAAVGE